MTTVALTTTFTPPPECLSDVYRYNDNQLLGPMTSDCYPPGWKNATSTFWSPGICPSGYTTACIAANTVNTFTETIATCCPTNFICANPGFPMGCRSTIIGGQSQLITVMRTDFATISKTETEIIGGNLNAYGVNIRFQATDLAQNTKATSTANTTPSSGATTPSPSAIILQPSPPPKSTSPPHSGLSTGAEAGIGVGIALAVCIGLVLLWLGWRHSKRRRSLAEMPVESEGTRESKPRVEDGVKYTPVEDYPVLHEMPGGGLPEAPGEELRHEVGGDHDAYQHEWGRSGR